MLAKMAFSNSLVRRSWTISWKELFCEDLREEHHWDPLIQSLNKVDARSITLVPPSGLTVTRAPYCTWISIRFQSGSATKMRGLLIGARTASMNSLPFWSNCATALRVKPSAPAIVLSSVRGSPSLFRTGTSGKLPSLAWTASMSGTTIPMWLKVFGLSIDAGRLLSGTSTWSSSISPAALFLSLFNSEAVW